MSDLKTNLQEILQEKQDKIIPENIKKDVQIFDVTGTYEGSGSSTTGVKLFETVEEMQADSTAQEGDLAVVYREETQNMTAETQTQYITFPETVVLPEAFTSDVYCMLSAVDETVIFDGQVMLNQSMFDFNGYTELGTITVQYTSTDGMNYTRTTFTGDSGDLTNPVYLGTQVQIQGWDDAIGYFMQINGGNFGGLYEYTIYQSKRFVSIGETKFCFPEELMNFSDVITLPNTNSSYTVNFLSSSHPKIINVLESVPDEKYPDVHCVTKASVYFGLETAYAIMVHIEDEDIDRVAIQLGTVDYGGFYAGYVYKVEYVNNILSTDLLSPSDMADTYESLASNPEGMYTNLYDLGEPSDYNYYVDYMGSVPYTTRVISSRGVTNLGTTNDDNPAKYIEFNITEQSYVIAPNQFTLTSPNQLLPGISAYGKNGVITGDGSMYDETISPTEYNTALDTTEQILGEEEIINE